MTQHLKHFPGQTVMRINRDGRRRPHKRPRTHKEDVLAFWLHVDKRGHAECWNWVRGNWDKFGYGKFVYRGRNIVAHRASFLIHFGSTKGLDVLHKCDNPTCVNPKHLFLGTQADNNLDAYRKGRIPKGEHAGRALLTAKQVTAIRKLYRPYVVTARILAHRFTVSTEAVYSVLHGRSWTHLL